MKKFFETISLKNLNPNQIYLLYCIKECREPDNINVYVDARALKSMGYIDKDLFLTDSGKSLLQELDSFFKAKAPKKEFVLDDDFVSSYLELWPSVKLPSGKYAKSDKKNIISNLKWFFENYSYSHSTVLKATAAYIDEYAANNYKYMRTSQYFIRKSDTDKSVSSELANYCSLIDDNDYKPPTTDFEDKVV
jgi:hypothetical protein